MTSLVTSAECVARAQTHLTAAEAMLAAEVDEAREWIAVALFYSAYHRVRAAILDDPIFESVARLSAVSTKLTMEDRMATHHNGRASDRGHRLGVTEIVPLIYPVISGPYRALAQASVDARYGSQMIAPLDDLHDRALRIHELADAGDLVAVAH